MVYRVNKKANALARTNRIFGGFVTDRNSLEYDCEVAQQQRGIFRKSAHLVRPMVNAHCFHDGNKRTASVAVLSELKPKGYKVDRRKLVKTMIYLSDKRIGEIPEIERRLKRCFKK